MGNQTRAVAGILCVLGLSISACDSKEQQKQPEAKADQSTPPASQPQAEPTPEKAVKNSVRLVVVGPAEPLGSEKAQVEELKGALKKAKLDYDAAPASEEEKKALGELASEKPVEVSSWSRYETVVVLELVAPEGTEKGKRISRGRGHLFIIHPPDKEPVFSTIYETSEKGAWLHGAKLGVWISTHLRYRRGDEANPPEPEKHEPVAMQQEKE